MTLGHANALYRLAYHLAGNADEAEDLTQETYLRAYRGSPGSEGVTFAPGCSLSCGMCSLTSVGDTAACPRSCQPMMMPMCSPRTMPGHGCRARRPRPCAVCPSEAVERAFAALPPDWRLVVLLADVEELSYREIADIMEIPLGTVMSRLHRAHRRLQERLLDNRQPGRNQHGRSA